MRLLFHIWGYFNISLTTDKPLITMHLLYTAKVEWSSKNVATRRIFVSFGLVLLLSSRRWLPKRCLTRAAGWGAHGYMIYDRHASNDSEQMLGISSSVNATRKHMQDWSYMTYTIWFMPSWYEQWKWIFARSMSWHEIMKNPLVCLVRELIPTLFQCLDFDESLLLL